MLTIDNVFVFTADLRLELVYLISSESTCFLFYKTFIKSKGHSEKFGFIMLLPNLALTTVRHVNECPV
eukprot:UN25941